MQTNMNVTSDRFAVGGFSDPSTAHLLHNPPSSTSEFPTQNTLNFDSPLTHCTIHGTELDETGMFCFECLMFPSIANFEQEVEQQIAPAVTIATMPPENELIFDSPLTHCTDHGTELDEDGICDKCCVVPSIDNFAREVEQQIASAVTIATLRPEQWTRLTEFAIIARHHIYNNGWIPTHHHINCICVVCCNERQYYDGSPYDHDSIYDEDFCHDPCPVHMRDNCVECEPTSMPCDICDYGEVDWRGKCDRCLPNDKNKGRR
jgi:hypothetical protein